MKRYHRLVRYWLILGCVMLFFQIIIGGVTRITGSGLSITKWEIVTGTFPPMNATDWNTEFDLYKNTPQYEKINKGMDLSEFKFIYFWEYFHRLWARMMGLIFIIPLFFFCLFKWVDKPLLLHLLKVFLGAVAAASFGWIMVASGLIERPWVNAYKLTIHLSIAAITLAFLVWATLYSYGIQSYINYKGTRFLKLVFGVFIIQFILGGIMSGMRASLVYPTWPNIGDKLIPNELTWSNISIDNFLNYDGFLFAPAFFHFCHRNVAYLFLVLSVIYVFKYGIRTIGLIRQSSLALIGLVFCQVILGILTLLNSFGKIPLFLGVMHQAFAVLILTTLILQLFLTRRT